MDKQNQPVEAAAEPALDGDLVAVATSATTNPQTTGEPVPVAIKQPDDVGAEANTKPSSPASATVVEMPTHQRSSGFGLQARRAAILATAIGLGWLGGWATSLSASSNLRSLAMVGSGNDRLPSPLFGHRAESSEVAQLASDLQAMKNGLEQVKASLDRNLQDDTHRLVLLGERLDAMQLADREGAAQLANLVQRAEQTAGTKLAGLAERFEKVERADRDPIPRLTQIAERLERMERQVAAPTPASKPVAVTSNEPTHTNAIAESKPSTVENWALREVYNGVALIEGKNRRLMEIVPGQNLPGVGRVEAIERRGKSWIVVTSRGVITSQAW